MTQAQKISQLKKRINGLKAVNKIKRDATIEKRIKQLETVLKTM